MKGSLTILCTIISFQFCIGQQFEVVNHNYPNFHDFPSNIFFAEDADESIWLFQGGGFTGDIISIYKDENWGSVSFDECTYCVYNITSDANGVIYLATNIGFFAFENDTWVNKSGSDIARSDIGFDSDGNLWFTSDGDIKNLAYLNSNNVTTIVEEVEGDIDNLTVSDDDFVWFYNDQKIGSYSDSDYKPYETSANHLEIDGDNNAWFIDFQGRIGKIEGDEILTNQLTNADNGFQILSMAIDRKNDLLYMGQQGTEPGLMMVDLKTESNQLVDSELLFPGEIALVNSLFVSSKGSVWVGARFSPNIAEVQPEIISSINAEIIKVNVYPNPTSNSISIDNLGGKDIFLDLYTITGFKIGNIVAISGVTNIDVTEFKAGLYFIGNREIGFEKVEILK